MKQDTSVIKLPKVIFGTSGLGNLYIAPPESSKQAVVEQCLTHSSKPAVFDSAGKYGAGQSLESLGNCLRQLHAKPEDVMISNKLGWYRVPLQGSEPTFEPGVWKDITHDAEQRISYDGILECFEQGNELLGNFPVSLVSVHDPDEYLAAAKSENDRHLRFGHVKDAYRALFQLKKEGRVKAVGVGSKDWSVIREITDEHPLDWVMIANSMTLHSHPEELLGYMEDLGKQGVAIINSAVFNGGFITGGDFYNYKKIDPRIEAHRDLLEWRDQFFAVCKKHQVEPAHAGLQFGLHAPGVTSIAVSTSRPEKVKINFDMAEQPLPGAFWSDLKDEGIIDTKFPV